VDHERCQKARLDRVVDRAQQPQECIQERRVLRGHERVDVARILARFIERDHRLGHQLRHSRRPSDT
jgi:hypothetical protein